MISILQASYPVTWRFLAILAALFTVACVAAGQSNSSFGLVPDDILQLSMPASHIVPEDIVPESVQLVRFSTPPATAVRFTYTEVGAQKMLAFWEAHEGQTVRLVIGKFQTQTPLAKLNVLPPGVTNYTQWKEGWLTRRTDKVFVKSEQDAQKIIEGLTAK